MFNKEDFKKYCEWIDETNIFLAGKHREEVVEWEKENERLQKGWWRKLFYDPFQNLFPFPPTVREATLDGFLQFMKDNLNKPKNARTNLPKAKKKN